MLLITPESARGQEDLGRSACCHSASRRRGQTWRKLAALGPTGAKRHSALHATARRPCSCGRGPCPSLRAECGAGQPAWPEEAARTPRGKDGSAREQRGAKRATGSKPDASQGHRWFPASKLGFTITLAVPWPGNPVAVSPRAFSSRRNTCRLFVVRFSPAPLKKA